MFEFCYIKLEYSIIDKLATNWQNFTQVRLQLKNTAVRLTLLNDFILDLHNLYLQLHGFEPST